MSESISQAVSESVRGKVDLKRCYEYNECKGQDMFVVKKVLPGAQSRSAAIQLLYGQTHGRRNDGQSNKWKSFRHNHC